MTFAGALRKGRSLFAHGPERCSAHDSREFAEPAEGRDSARGLGRACVGVGLVWSCSRRLGPSLLRASGIRHGSVSGWPTGFYSESIANNTNSLVVRKTPIITPDLPAAPYVENIGARPDVPIDYMTRDNLLNGGRPFVNEFTQVLTREIRNKATETTFTISGGGAASGRKRSWRIRGAHGRARCRNR